jgi:hypothetical protein
MPSPVSAAQSSFRRTGDTIYTNMTQTHRIAAAVLVLFSALPTAFAQTAAVKPATAKPAAKPVAKKLPPKTPEQPTPAAADAEQIQASERVYYGMYDCEFKQTVNITASPKFPAYVDVRHGKNDYLMKPVLSSTGAIRLEDVRGETLMVQIASKSMLLNVVTAHRIVDDCISPKQRELIEAARAAKAAQLASAEGASAPSGTTLIAAPQSK